LPRWSRAVTTENSVNSLVRSRRRFGGACRSGVALLVTAMAGSAAAADPVRIPARLEWGVSVCGDAQGFASRVLRRTQRVRFVEQGEDLTVFLSIEPQGTGLEARAEMRSSGRQILNRRIASPDCDDALDALALVVAISLEGRASEMERIRLAPKPRPPPRKAPLAAVVVEPAQPAEPAVTPPAEPPPPSEPTPSIDQAPAAPPEPAPEPPPAAVVVEPPPPASAESQIDLPPEPEPAGAEEGFWFAAGLSAEMALGVAPSPMLGAGAWASATWERAGILSPAVTIGFSHVRLEGYQQPEGEADFALNAGSLVLCPVRFGSARFELRPCAAGSLGQTGSVGHDTFFAEDYVRPWATLGGSILGLARFGPVEVRTNVVIAAPLVRDSFAFGAECPENTCESDVFYRVNAVVTQVGIGVGLGF